MKKLSVVFCATPEIANNCLEFLNESKSIDLKLVVSMPDRPAGRGKELRSPAVISLAKKLGIKTFQSENLNKDELFKEWLSENEVDLFIVFAFAQFLGSRILEHPKMGCFNIHTSLLPKYRGAAPMQYALFNGDKETGICIQKMVSKMDAGDIAGELKLTIKEEDNLGTLHDQFQLMAPKLLEDFIFKVQSDSLSLIKQDESNVSFAPSIPKDKTVLNFLDNSSLELLNLIRGISPIPAAYCFLNNKRLKVFEGELSEVKLNPGETSVKFNSLLVGTKEGSIRLKTVQIEGKGKCKDNELLNGLKNSFDDFIITSTKDKK
ncbi:MAG: methionyl-tRNA formyltransferase [Bacteriovoracaceae bacterium]